MLRMKGRLSVFVCYMVGEGGKFSVNISYVPREPGGSFKPCLFKDEIF